MNSPRPGACRKVDTESHEAPAQPSTSAKRFLLSPPQGQSRLWEAHGH